MRQSLLLALVTLAIAGCGQPAEPDIAQTTFAASLAIDLATMTKSATGLYSKDLTVGTGAAVVTGQQVSIRYTGSLVNGTVFDSNAAPATPFKFTLGVGQVIAGFDEGILGMKVGGRRQVIIPPTLGYGASVVGGIPAHSILVFTIEIVSTP
ncbi:MAG: FKBP-type peptidyl-prolyl cis-trans isomerase [Gemmatimonadetes bacterium]|nr:FKBP-type peptidyl-prolyl cis-trans isomerase [Gemmatimonadota bacterium]